MTFEFQSPSADEVAESNESFDESFDGDECSAQFCEQEELVTVTATDKRGNLKFTAEYTTGYSYAKASMQVYSKLYCSDAVNFAQAHVIEAISNIVDQDLAFIVGIVDHRMDELRGDYKKTLEASIAFLEATARRYPTESGEAIAKAKAALIELEATAK